MYTAPGAAPKMPTVNCSICCCCVEEIAIKTFSLLITQQKITLNRPRACTPHALPKRARGRSNGRSITEIKFQMHVMPITCLKWLLHKSNKPRICLLTRDFFQDSRGAPGRRPDVESLL